MKSVWLLNHYGILKNYNRSDLIAQIFADKGYNVVLISSSFIHGDNEYLVSDKITSEQVSSKIKKVLIRTAPKYNSNGIRRLLNMISYCVISYFRSKSISKKYLKPDIVIGTSVHPFAWIGGILIANKFKAKFVAEIRDIWPLSLVEVEGISRKHPIVHLFSMIEKITYKKAQLIITSMPFANNYLYDYHRIDKKRVIWMPNVLDTEKFEIDASKNELTDTLLSKLHLYPCCVYTGTLASYECVEHILKVARYIEDNYSTMNINFLVIGDGYDKERLIALSNDLQLENISFIGWLTKSQIAQVLIRSEICLAAVNDLGIYRYGLSMNKLNDYLFSGTPTVFACNYQNIVQESGAGLCVKSNDVIGYGEAIIEIINKTKLEKKNMGIKGKEYILANYSKKTLIQRVDYLLEMLK